MKMIMRNLQHTHCSIANFHYFFSPFIQFIGIRNCISTTTTWKKSSPSFIRLYHRHCHRVDTLTLEIFFSCLLASSSVRRNFSCFQLKTLDLQVFQVFSFFFFDLKLGFHRRTNYQTIWMSLSHSFYFTAIQYDQNDNCEVKKNLQTKLIEIEICCDGEDRRKKKTKFDAYQMFVAHRFLWHFFLLSYSKKLYDDVIDTHTHTQ